MLEVGGRYVWKDSNQRFEVIGYSRRFVYYKTYNLHPVNRYIWGYSQELVTSRNHFNVTAEVDKEWLYRKQMKEIINESN